MEKFGETIKRLRESQKLPLRKVAAALDIDTSTLSKIERGERNANKEIAALAASYFKYDLNELNIALLSDKVAYELLEEAQCSQILKVAEEKIRYIRSKSVEQSTLKFK